MDKHVVSWTQRQAGRKMVRKENINGSELDKINKITCAPSKDSGQHGHLASQIIALLWLGLQVLMKRLSQTDLSSLGAQVIFLVLSCSGSNYRGLL